MRFTLPAALGGPGPMRWRPRRHLIWRECGVARELPRTIGTGGGSGLAVGAGESGVAGSCLPVPVPHALVSAARAAECLAVAVGAVFTPCDSTFRV